MKSPTAEEYKIEFDLNMKIYITEKIRAGKPLDNLDEKYKKKYASFIEATKKKYRQYT